MTKKEKEEKENRKSLPIVLFALGFLVIGGVSLAFFSDILLGEADVTAGSLDLQPATEGQDPIQFFLNGSSTAMTDPSIANFNPGDCVLVKGNAKNDGNKSAWVRSTIKLDGINGTTFTNDAVKIAVGNHTLDETGVTWTSINSMSDGISTTPVILNGTGTAAETETGGLSAYNADAFTICFDPEATNEQQLKTADFDVRIEAVQYRNNNTGTVDWSDAKDMEAEFTAGS